MNTLELISDIGILPVIGMTAPETAVPLAKLLYEEGIPVIEITLRAAGALEGIKRIKSEMPGMAVLAGTVLTKGQIDDAVAAGVNGIVTPGLDSEIVEYCQKQNVPVTPGCSTATEITQAAKMELEIIKYFPAELNGGIAALKLFHGPFPNLQFIPTGGIDFSNLGSYLANPFIAACGGSYMAKSADIIGCNWDLIRSNCRKCIDISLGLELAYVVINHDNAEKAENAAKRMATLFRVPVKCLNKSIFAGKAVENMMTPGCGENGHIAFAAASVKRALAYYKRNGIAICEESLRHKTDGSLEMFYLEEEISGFAVQIMQK